MGGSKGVDWSEQSNNHVKLNSKWKRFSYGCPGKDCVVIYGSHICFEKNAIYVNMTPAFLPHYKSPRRIAPLDAASSVNSA